MRRTLSLAAGLLAVFGICTEVAVAQLTYEPKVKNVMPGAVGVLTSGGSNDNVVLPEGAQGQITIHYHDAAGAGTTKSVPLPPAQGRGWSFEIDFGDAKPTGVWELSIDLQGPDGSVAAPVLRRTAIPLSDKPAIAHPYTFERFYATTRLLYDVMVAPISTRIELGELTRLGVDTERVTHGALAYPVEFLLTSKTEGPWRAREATIDPETAEYFGHDELIGLGGKFIEFSNPCEHIQVYLDESAARWGRWVGSPWDRRYTPTHWTLACQNEDGSWEVIVEGRADENACGDGSGSALTLSQLLEVPNGGARRFIFAAFVQKGNLKPLAPPEPCPVELPR